MIQVGDKIPNVTVTAAAASGPEPMTTDAIFGGKKVVLFAVPGAFTPTCSVRHLPGFLENAQAFFDKGVDSIACIAVNDVFVMGAWAKEQGTEGRILMLADGSAEFARAVGLDMDLTARGMGIRSRRYALVAEDGVVTVLRVEESGAFEASKAEAVLAAL